MHTALALKTVEPPSSHLFLVAPSLHEDQQYPKEQQVPLAEKAIIPFPSLAENTIRHSPEKSHIIPFTPCMRTKRTEKTLFKGDFCIVIQKNRYYSSEQGRFISRDPIGYRAGVNLYGYVKNRPTYYFDPLGLRDIATVGGSIIVISNPWWRRMFGAPEFDLQFISGPEAQRIVDAESTSDVIIAMIIAMIIGELDDDDGGEGQCTTNPAGEPDIVEHSSERAARRAAEREAGMGRHGDRERLPNEPLAPGSQSPEGDPGERTIIRYPGTGRSVHHDRYGHRFPDGDTIPPHYGVDSPEGGTTHHTYPSDHDPGTNR